MKTEKTDEWNDGDWEEACVKELEARKRATFKLGVLSDENLFREFENYGILRGTEIGDEDADKLLSLAEFFHRLRFLLGKQGDSFIAYSDIYLEELAEARAAKLNTLPTQ